MIRLFLPCLLAMLLILQSCQDNHPSVEPPDHPEGPQKETAAMVPTPPWVKVIFSSLDDLTITARLYHHSDTAPSIVLCHQARFNKFEYESIAEVLYERGYNCLAIDQRSGGPIASMQNETKLEAMRQGKPTEFLDAEQDIVAAVNYMYNKYHQPVILWGSSYSATLALYVGIENEKVGAVVSFSPGNYLAEERGDLVPLLKDCQKPFYITSSQSEIKYVDELLAQHELKGNQVHFKPTGPGHHGSRALWKNQDGGMEYWESVLLFLENLSKQ